MSDEEGGDKGECSIDEVKEEDWGSAEVIITVVTVDLADDILEWVEGGEHDHEGHTEVGSATSLLGGCVGYHEGFKDIYGIKINEDHKYHHLCM